MIKIIHASLATVEELFQFKHIGQDLPSFPGYTKDQWGIKAHNRPWIEFNGDFQKGQKIIEVGGAYSTLPKYLGKKYDLENWIGDDFGKYNSESLWSRWGEPTELIKRNPETKYIFEPFGRFSDNYPDNYFDKIFSVSTLEHIPIEYRLNVFKDMNRCMKKGGLQLHTIDIPVPNVKSGLYHAFGDKYKFLRKLSSRFNSEISSWINIMRGSGIAIDKKIPNTLNLFNRRNLAESYDVVYSFYPPINSPKSYDAAASLLVIIKKF